jgi:DNA-binding FrmR family transcriptional regulator
MNDELRARKRDPLARLKTVRRHLDGIFRMLETDAYYVDVMTQISAAQCTLEKANRPLLRGHLETCFSHAVLDGRGQQAIDALTDAVRFEAAVTGPDADLTHAASAAGRGRVVGPHDGNRPAGRGGAGGSAASRRRGSPRRAPRVSGRVAAVAG